MFSLLKRWDANEPLRLYIGTLVLAILGALVALGYVTASLAGVLTTIGLAVCGLGVTAGLRAKVAPMGHVAEIVDTAVATAVADTEAVISDVRSFVAVAAEQSQAQVDPAALLARVQLAVTERIGRHRRPG